MKLMLIQAEPPDDIQDFNFPMGYAALDSVLTRAGHEVELLFTIAHQLSEKDIADRIRASRPQVVGIGGMWPYLPRVEMLVKLIRDTDPDIKVVLGGWMVTYLPELVLRKAEPNFCIAGEGEIAFLKLITALDGKTDYSEIPGLTFRHNGQTISNGLGELMALDDLPIPNWEKFPMEYYLRVGWYFKSFCTGYDRVMGWATSRGCPGKCNFCTPGTSLRYKKMDLLMAELHEIEDRFHPTFMYWMDNLTMGSIAYGKKFVQALMDENFKFRYFMTGRVDRVDRELLGMLKESGCSCILYGLESANNDLLKSMGKNITIEQFVDAIRMTKEAGIGVNISGMFGQPGETLQDFYNTFKVIMTATDRRMPYSNNQGFYPLTTFPGAPIYDWAREHGYFKDDNDYYNKFFRHRWLNFTDYPRDVVQTALNVGNILNTWNFHHHKALSLEDSLFHIQASRSPEKALQHLSYRLREKIAAAPQIKAKAKKILQKWPSLYRLVRKMLGLDEHTGAPPQAAVRSKTGPATPGAPQKRPLHRRIRTGIKEVLQKWPWLYRLARKALRLDKPPKAPPPPRPSDQEQTDALLSATTLLDGKCDIDPQWKPQKQLDRFIDLMIERYFLAEGDRMVLEEQVDRAARQAGTDTDTRDSSDRVPVPAESRLQ